MASDPNRLEPLPWGRLLRTRIHPSASRPRHIQLVDFLLGYAHDQENHGVRPIFGKTRRSGRLMARLAEGKSAIASGENLNLKLQSGRVRSKMRGCEGATVGSPSPGPSSKVKVVSPTRRSRKRARNNTCAPTIEAPPFSDTRIQHNAC